MNKNNESLINELIWEQVKDQITEVSTELASIINSIEPNNELTFIRVKYPFGSMIVENGILNLPVKNANVMPINGPNIPNYIKNKLNYNTIPLGIIVKNGIEIFRELDASILTITNREQGLDLGIWEHLGWTTPYDVSAGARSLYMIPRITLTSGHKRLKREYDVRLPPPKTSFEHWKVFKQIVNSDNFPESWFCEIIFLSNLWIEKLNKFKNKQSSGWYKLHNYLVNKNLQHSFYARRRSIFEWELFSHSLKKEGLKANPYILATLKHLAFIGTGGAPGSRPNTGGTELGPIPTLQQIYIDCYGLKEYVPTIMQPQYFSLEKNKPIYYSLQTPTLLESSPKSRNMLSIVDNIRELRDLTSYFLKDLFDKHLKIENVSINEMISQLQFEFFHEKCYAYGNDIRPTSEMPLKDPDLIYMPGELKGRKFADTSAYLHGCVRISRKEKK